jgi:hypothetical protein
MRHFERKDFPSKPASEAALDANALKKQPPQLLPELPGLALGLHQFDSPAAPNGTEFDLVCSRC